MNVNKSIKTICSEVIMNQGKKCKRQLNQKKTLNILPSSELLFCDEKTVSPKIL